MRKKIALLATEFAMAVTANAQFQQGKGYIGASLTGLDIHYNGAEKFNLGLEAKGGYLFMDNLMALAGVGYEHSGREDVADKFSVSVGLLRFCRACSLRREYRRGSAV